MSEYKCKDCKWLTGKKTIRGIECMNPKLQEKWNGAKNLWMGELRKDNARYKQASGLACKKFELKEQTMSDDLIKRSDAIKIMACEMYAEAQAQGYEVDSIEDFIPEAKAWMADAPNIDIEPKQGEWIIHSNGKMCDCSACNESYDRTFEYVDEWNFCPNCGARMKGGRR